MKLRKRLIKSKPVFFFNERELYRILGKTISFYNKNTGVEKTAGETPRERKYIGGKPVWKTRGGKDKVGKRHRGQGTGLEKTGGRNLVGKRPREEKTGEKRPEMGRPSTTVKGCFLSKTENFSLCTQVILWCELNKISSLLHQIPNILSLKRLSLKTIL